MGSAKRVLIVDDSKLSRMIIAKVISENFDQWLITEAEDAASALEYAQQTQFDFITLDNNMPGHSGFDIYPQLKEFQSTAQIAIITANIQKSIQDKFENLGATFYCKPINQDTLLEFFTVEA